MFIYTQRGWIILELCMPTCPAPDPVARLAPLTGLATVGTAKWDTWREGFVYPLTPNDTYRGRTAPLTSKRCILYIYSTNIGTEYFKHGIYSTFFLLKMQFVS